MTDSIDKMLRDLHDTASLPIEEAKALSPLVYISQEFHELEREKIFARDWQCVGRIEQVPEPNDYITSTVDTVPVYTINVGGGAVATFRNTCSHRNAVLLEGSGSARVIVCPYHAWSYVATDGCLRGAPHMNRSACFDRAASSLPEFRTEVWQGWIYVTLNQSARTVSERLSPLEAEIASYGMAEYRTIHCEDFSWNCNWKVLVDNFLDEYHPFWAHRQTFGNLVKADIAEIVTRPGDPEAWTLHYTPLPDAFSEAGRSMSPSLDEWHSHHVALFGVYPTQLVALLPGGPMFWLLLVPKGVERVEVRYGLSVPARLFAISQDTSDGLEDFYARVNAEDKLIVERVFRGLAASGAPQGPLSHLEWSTWEFQKYLSHRLASVTHD